MFSETFSSLLNGFVTIICGTVLFHLFYKQNFESYFHFFWFLGFILYGLEILLGAGIPLMISLPVVLFLFAFSLIFWIIGLALILKEKISKKFLITASLFGVLLTISLVLNHQGLTSLLILTFLVLITLILGILFARLKYGKIMDPLLFGWVMIGAINILYGIRVLPPFYADIFAFIAKVVIICGILNPNFQFVGTSADFLLKRGNLTLSQPSNTHFTLIRCEKISRLKELNWIKRIVTKSLTKNFEVTLIIIYDSISTQELKDLKLFSNSENIKVVRVLREIKEKTNDSLKVKDDLTSIGLLISKIIEKSREEKRHQVMVIYPLSWLILTHGWKSIYLLLLNKISELKESKTHLITFYYPKTHNDKTIPHILEKMAEQVMSI